MLIRPATPADAAAMTALLNRIIGIGGTTAHQHEKTETQVRANYIDGREALICLVAEDAGRVIGFQDVGVWSFLPAGWVYIGPFVAPGLQARGIGKTLFAATRGAARAAGLTTLNATIRGDNAPASSTMTGSALPTTLPIPTGASTMAPALVASPAGSICSLPGHVFRGNAAKRALDGPRGGSPLPPYPRKATSPGCSRSQPTSP
ncbi:MAG: GNAT family N-acetyltransferase [Rhodobacter sp.]|nr:GNAT family N-acetyltransferase [Rhodobacter sp.]